MADVSVRSAGADFAVRLVSQLQEKAKQMAPGKVGVETTAAAAAKLSAPVAKAPPPALASAGGQGHLGVGARSVPSLSRQVGGSVIARIGRSLMRKRKRTDDGDGDDGGGAAAGDEPDEDAAAEAKGAASRKKPRVDPLVEVAEASLSKAAKNQKKRASKKAKKEAAKKSDPTPAASTEPRPAAAAPAAVATSSSSSSSSAAAAAAAAVDTVIIEGEAFTSSDFASNWDDSEDHKPPAASKPPIPSRLSTDVISSAKLPPQPQGRPKQPKKRPPTHIGDTPLRSAQALARSSGEPSAAAPAPDADASDSDGAHEALDTAALALQVRPYKKNKKKTKKTKKKKKNRTK
jgi:hypothetical protein